MNVFDRAVAEFGVTDNPVVAGFILPDGRMLDFEGGDGGGYTRGLDHRSITAVQGSNADDAGTEAMLLFMGRGAVRMSMQRAGDLFLDIVRAPTRAQWSTIADLIGMVDEGIFEITKLRKVRGEVRSSRVAEMTWTVRPPMADVHEFVTVNFEAPSARAHRTTIDNIFRGDVVMKLKRGWEDVVQHNEILDRSNLTDRQRSILLSMLAEATDNYVNEHGQTLRNDGDGWYWD